MNHRHTLPHDEPSAPTRNAISSTPRGAAGPFGRSLPPGFFSGAAAGLRVAPQESAMNEDRLNWASRLTVRLAIMIAFAAALAIGGPWLLNDAPPSPEAVIAAAVCCAKAPNAAARDSGVAIAPVR
jgi:hypothetical protein